MINKTENLNNSIHTKEVEFVFKILCQLKRIQKYQASVVDLFQEFKEEITL